MAGLMCQMQAQLDDLMDWLDIDLEDEPDDQRLELEFEPNENNMPFESDLFILIECGEHAADILKLNDVNNKDFKKLATIPSERGLHSSCTLFKCRNKLLALLNTDSSSSAEVTELLRPYANLAKDVVIIQIKQMLHYKGILPKKAKSYESNFIRGINSKLNYVEELLPPNMISGASAGIASWRSYQGQRVSSYVIFTHKFSALEVLNFLNDVGLDWLKKPFGVHDELSFVVRRPYI